MSRGIGYRWGSISPREAEVEIYLTRWGRLLLWLGSHLIAGGKYAIERVLGTTSVTITPR